MFKAKILLIGIIITLIITLLLALLYVRKYTCIRLFINYFVTQLCFLF